MTGANYSAGRNILKHKLSGSFLSIGFINIISDKNIKKTAEIYTRVCEHAGKQAEAHLKLAISLI